jgi:hypothetical protein
MIAFADIRVLRGSWARIEKRAYSASAAAKGRENLPKLLQNIAEMDRQPPSAIYKFGPFALDIEAGMLLRGVEPTLLGQRAIALLRLLLDRAASPVSKDALVEAAWPGLAVEDSNLTVQIAALRRVLDQDGGAGWIEHRRHCQRSATSSSAAGSRKTVDCGPSFRALRRCCLVRRWHGRRHHHGPVAHQVAVRNCAQLQLRLS